MARDTVDDRPLESFEQMLEWFTKGCKPKADWRIGTEHEKFAFYTEDHSPVPYEGERGIEALLNGMQAELGWEPITDEGRIIGLAGGEGEGAISIEPGGQFELSGAPLETIHETCRESNQHLRAIKSVGRELGMGFLGLGSSPVWTFAETPRMPKSRYKIMSAYMPKVGTRGLDMMYRTATIQANLDFSDEDDMRRKLQVSLRLQPLTTALFANSPFTDGKLNGELSWRGGVWRDVDNQRGGYQPQMLDPAFGFEEYVKWCLDIPMYFIIRDGRYVDMTHMTFREFFEGKAASEMPGVVPTMGDWSNHVSTLFPDVRLKRFLEMRGADGGPWRRICALPAFWVGLLYDGEALDAAEALVKDWTVAETQALRDSAPTSGLDSGIAGRSLHMIARDVLEISRLGLKNRNRLNVDGFDEAHFLAPLEEIVARGPTDAQEMLAAWHTRWDHSVEPLFTEYAY